jgi:hypothetical protein
MATVNLTVLEVINFSAARLNDVNKTVYTDAIQLPFVNIALAELQELYEANNIPVTDQTSAIIEVDADVSGILEIGFAITPPDPPELPIDLIEPKVLWESPRGLEQWTPMVRLDFLPEYQIGAQINQFVYYQWATNKIKVLAANADNDIKMDYVRALFTTVTDVDDDLFVQNSLSYLGNRVASLIAADIEENQDRAQRLYGDALSGLDRALTIPTKGRQRITTRRRPFRAGYKASRSCW